MNLGMKTSGIFNIPDVFSCIEKIRDNFQSLFQEHFYFISKDKSYIIIITYIWYGLEKTKRMLLRD